MKSRVPRTVEVPYGPQHPGLHEPILLKLYVEGEEVVDAKVTVGFNHRGIEYLLERASWPAGVHIATRVCGICNVVHSEGYTWCVEQLLPVKVDERARYLRVLALELERIHSHILITAIAAEMLGAETLFMLLMRNREMALNAKEILHGNRVYGDYIIPGGVARNPSQEELDKIKRILERMKPETEKLLTAFIEDPIVRKRMDGVVKIPPSEVKARGLVGPVARASKVYTDMRWKPGYEVYKDLGFEPVVKEEGDSLARMEVRVEETMQSFELCFRVLEEMPKTGDPVPKVLPRKAKPGEAIGRVEAPRGELVYYAVSDGGVKPYRLKIRTPSFANVIGTADLFVGLTLPDVPAFLVSLDPCLACMERAIQVVRLK